MPRPEAIVVPLSHEVPVLWRDGRTGETWVNAAPAVTPVRIRGVRLGEMRAMAERLDYRYTVKFRFEGRTWMPFTCLSPSRTDDLGRSQALRDIVPVRIPEAIRKWPKGGIGAADRARIDAGAILRPDPAASGWAARRFERDVIHDGDVLLRACHGTPHPLHGSGAASRDLASMLHGVLSDGADIARKDGPDSALHARIEELKRTFVLALVEADDSRDRDTAMTVARQVVRDLAARHPHRTARERMAIMDERLDERARPQDPVDAEALADLAW